MIIRSKEKIKQDIISNEKDNKYLQRELECEKMIDNLFFERDCLKDMLLNDGYDVEEIESFVKARLRIKDK